MEINKIIQGDSLDVLKTLPSDSIDCVITSPPYWALRSYLPKDHPDKAKEIGSEPTFKEFLDKMMLIFAETKRVLKPTGSFWLNFGDAYFSNDEEYDNDGIEELDYQKNGFSSQNQYDECKDVDLNDNLDKSYHGHKQSHELSEKNRFHNEVQNDHFPNEDFSHEVSHNFSSKLDQGQVLNSKHASSFSEKKSKKVLASCESQKNVSSLNHENRLGKPSLLSGSFSGDVQQNENIDHAYPSYTKTKIRMQAKSLMMQPARIAIRMCDEQGWILRADINWIKQVLVYKKDAKYTMGSVMPSSVKDRVNMASEHLFHFTKSRRYFYDIDAIRIPSQVCGVSDFRDVNGQPSRLRPKRKDFAFNYRVRDSVKKAGNPQFTASDEEIKNYGKKSMEARMEDTNNKDTKSSRAANMKKLLSEVRLGVKPNTGMIPNYENENFSNPSGKNIPNNWLIGTEPSKEHHFAKFPSKLCEIPILASCPKGGIVMDIFSGSGTALAVAQKLGRNWLGIELNPAYIEISKPKLKQEILL